MWGIEEFMWTPPIIAQNFVPITDRREIVAASWSFSKCVVPVSRSRTIPEQPSGIIIAGIHGVESTEFVDPWVVTWLPGRTSTSPPERYRPENISYKDPEHVISTPPKHCEPPDHFDARQLQRHHQARLRSYRPQRPRSSLHVAGYTQNSRAITEQKGHW
nr:hypothetical protein Iba_chr07dCG8810 [Ipomoea batatas]GMD66413.1 hypothetical protein Iba_chr12cCG14780 [Ipomoea batatas]